MFQENEPFASGIYLPYLKRSEFKSSFFVDQKLADISKKQ